MKDAKKNFLKSINDNKTKLKSVEPIEKKVNTTIQDELNVMKNKLKPTKTNPKKKYVSNKELQDALDKRNEKINPSDEDSDDDPDNTWSTTGEGGKKHKKHKRKTQKNKKKLSKKKKQNNKKKTNKKKKTKSKK